MDKTLNLANVSKEVKLILQLLKKNNEQYVFAHKEELCKDIDWDYFISLVKHHRVFPSLSSKVGMLDGFIPSFVTRYLNKQYKKNTFQMLYLSGEMENVSKLFTKSNIRLLFLKGPIIGHGLYGDISLRTSSDLDMLIPIEQLEMADEILLKLGYEKDDYIQSILNDWKWRHHHVTYFHPGKNIKLEIHWRMNPGPNKEPKFNELWERKQCSTLTSYPIYYLGLEDLFLFLVSHGARHGWSRLRWLLDIQQIMRQEMDWKRVYVLLKRYHHCHAGGQSILLASELLNADIDDDIKELLVEKRSQDLAQQAIFYLEKMVNLHTEPVPDEVARYHKRHLFLLMSTQQKILFILSFLYPYPEDAETLPLPKQLHLLYFPFRPLLWAWRKTGKYINR